MPLEKYLVTNSSTHKFHLMIDIKTEAISTLKNKGPKDLTKLSYFIAKEILLSSGLAKTDDEAKKMVENSIKSGKALEKFELFVVSAHFLRIG